MLGHQLKGAGCTTYYTALHTLHREHALRNTFNDTLTRQSPRSIHRDTTRAPKATTRASVKTAQRRADAIIAAGGTDAQTKVCWRVSCRRRVNRCISPITACISDIHIVFTCSCFTSTCSQVTGFKAQDLLSKTLTYFDTPGQTCYCTPHGLWGTLKDVIGILNGKKYKPHHQQVESDEDDKRYHKHPHVWL